MNNRKRHVDVPLWLYRLVCADIIVRSLGDFFGWFR